MPHRTNQVHVFATSAAGSAWWLIDQLARHGPGWPLVPPILLGLASFTGALRGWLDGVQARRHAEREHRARLDLLTNHCPPGMERLN